jgi:hypothetical protein
MEKLITLGHSHPNVAFLYAIASNSFLAVTQILAKYAMGTLSSF